MIRPRRASIKAFQGPLLARFCGGATITALRRWTPSHLVLLLLAIPLGTMVASIVGPVDLFDWWYEFTRGHEDWELDELVPGLILALGIALGFMAQRIGQSRRDLIRSEAAGRDARDSEQRFRDFAEIGSDWLWETDADHRFTFVSERCEAATGLPAAAILGKACWDIIEPKADDTTWVRFRNALARRRRVSEFMVCFVDAEGKTRHWSLSGKPLFDAEGEFLGYRGVGSDQTLSNWLREQATTAQTRLMSAIESMPVDAMLFDTDERLILSNRKVIARNTGPSTPLHTGISFAEMTRLELANGVLAPVDSDQNRWLKGRVQRFRSGSNAEVMKLADGRWLLVLERRTPAGDILCIRTDITTLKRNEQELAEKSIFLRMIIENMAQGLLVFDKDLRLAVWNDRAMQIMDFPPDYAKVGRPMADFLTFRAKRGDFGPGDVDRIVAERLTTAGLPQDETFDEVGPKAKVVAVRRCELPNGGFIATFTDITRRRHDEAALTNHRKLLQAIVDAVPAMVSAKDRDSRYILMNRFQSELYGVAPEQAVGKTSSELIGQDYGAYTAILDRQVIDSGTALPFFEERAPDAFGIQHDWLTTKVPLKDQTGKVTSLVTVALDMTERKRTERDLLHAQKMESLGQLTGGVAHEFNNLLTAIGGFARMAQKRIEKTDHVLECLGEVTQATERAATLTREMLAFSRKQPMEQKIVCLADTVDEVQRLLAPVLGETIDLSVQHRDRQARAFVDTGQISQVLVNLCINARDAMPKGGKITIASDVVSVAQDAHASAAILCPGRYVVLSVADSGTGMDEATAKQAFEPFFTTKEPGKGTGLGLSVAYGIVDQMGGTIELDTAPGEGSTFTIYLPLVESEEPTMPAPFELNEPRAASRQATVLVAEDDPAVCRLVEAELSSLGFKVLMAGNGREAVELARTYEHDIEVLLTDVSMPEMGGPEAARAIQACRPETKVVFMSGYTTRGNNAAFALPEDAVVVFKPFSERALVEAIDSVLVDERSDQSGPFWLGGPVGGPSGKLMVTGGFR